MRKLYVGATAALLATPLMALPAWAGTCASTSASVYTASGFSCSVDGLTFSDITINTTGSVTLGNITPFDQTIADVVEVGLTLNYSALAGNNNPGSADVSWSFDVTGSNISDAYVELTGTTSGSGTIGVTENLTNTSTGQVTTLTLTGAGSTTGTFLPATEIFAAKDQGNVAGTGYADSSLLTDAFSVSTPIPGALPLFAGGLVVLWALRRRPTKGRLNSALG